MLHHGLVVLDHVAGHGQWAKDSLNEGHFAIKALLNGTQRRELFGERR